MIAGASAKCTEPTLAIKSRSRSRVPSTSDKAGAVKDSVTVGAIAVDRVEVSALANRGNTDRIVVHRRVQAAAVAARAIATATSPAVRADARFRRH